MFITDTSRLFSPTIILLFTTLWSIITTQVLAEDDDNDGESTKEAYATDRDDTVLGIFHPNSSTGYATLVVYALVICVLGWMAIIYPFHFRSKFFRTLNQYQQSAVVSLGRILSVRRGRVFQPLHFLLPPRHNCYLTVEFESASGNGEKIVKELYISDEAFTSIKDSNTSFLEVYGLPEYAHSGFLAIKYQQPELTWVVKLLYIIGATILLGVGVWTSLVTTSDVLYSRGAIWKFLLVLLGHLISFLLAYWACNFAYRNKMESILYSVCDGDGFSETAPTSSNTEKHHLTKTEDVASATSTHNSTGTIEMGRMLVNDKNVNESSYIAMT